jgi:hypothetical protein
MLQGNRDPEIHTRTKIVIVFILGGIWAVLNIFFTRFPRKKEVTVKLPVLRIFNGKRTLDAWHLCWFIPVLGLSIAHKLLKTPDEGDVICYASEWSPMIPWIAHVTWIPLLGIDNYRHIREKIRATFGPALFLNVFGRPLPDEILPTMETVMDKPSLFQRKLFFVPNIAVYVCLHLTGIEIWSRLTEKWDLYQEKSRQAMQKTRAMVVHHGTMLHHTLTRHATFLGGSPNDLEQPLVQKDPKEEEAKKARRRRRPTSASQD